MEFYELMNTENLLKSAFLAENREALGLISEATPLAANGLLLAARGYVANDGMRPPTFTVGRGGVEGLYDGLYHSVLDRTDTNRDILRRTFGDTAERQTHPISRYVAAMTEALAYEILTEGNCLPQGFCIKRLSSKIPAAIDSLHEIMRSISGPRPGSERFFAASLFACRCRAVSRHTYDLEIYAAGDYVLYLLDEQGMAPLWTTATDMLTGHEGGSVEGDCIRVVHEAPFALLLLSRNACEPSATEVRLGSLWLHRMRTEEQIVRLISSAPDSAEFAERAQRFYEGHPVGNESIQGAMTVIGGTFDEIRNVCHERLTKVERMLTLFPVGCEPGEQRRPISLEESEKSFILDAFNTRQRLLEQTKEMLVSHAKQCLYAGPEASPASSGEDGSRRLTYADVAEVFDAYDCENYEDREEIFRNNHMLRELLSEHWLTLRPILCDAPVTSDAVPAYDACVRLGRKISRLIAHRRKCLVQMEQMLSDSLRVLEFRENDWVNARGGDGGAETWFAHLEEDIPLMTQEISSEWARASDLLRSLQSAYTQEREKLFQADAVAETGAWHDTYLLLLNGTLEHEKWQAYGEAVLAEAPAFSDLWEALRNLSIRNRQLNRRIDSRAAERRAMRAISENEDWQMACMIGSLRGDEGWGDCSQMIDRAFVNEYRAFMRRMQEEKELFDRRRVAFETYKEMYEAFEV